MILQTLWLAASLAACIPVDGDRILARDLVPAVPAFQALPPETVIGYAPVPGARRLFYAVELARLAARYQLTLDSPQQLCVERTTEELTADRVRQALGASVGQPGAHIDLVDFSRYRVPRGEIQFPPGGITAPADPATPALWRGFVKYAGNRQFSIWARVRIWVATPRVVAQRPLAAGRAIEADAVHVETAETFPFGRQPAASLDLVIGRVPRRAIPAGAAVFAYLLDAPREVRSGDRVTVDVESGRAKLSLEGRAEASGREGEVISVRNPATGRTFRATVEGRGKVALRMSAPTSGGEK